MSLFCSRREQNNDINTEIFGIVKLYGVVSISLNLAILAQLRLASCDTHADT